MVEVRITQSLSQLLHGNVGFKNRRMRLIQSVIGNEHVNGLPVLRYKFSIEPFGRDMSADKVARFR